MGQEPCWPWLGFKREKKVFSTSVPGFEVEPRLGRDQGELEDDDKW